MSQHKAIFNNGQTGTLPAVSVVRDTTKEDIVDGGTVAVNTAAYGHASARTEFNEWTETVSGTSSWHYPAAGYDHNGTTKMAASFRPGNALLCIWLNTDIDGAVVADGGSAVVEFDIERATSQTLNEEVATTSTIIDIMQGASVSAGDVLHSEQVSNGDVALRPRSCIVLPGCFIFVCERMRNTTGVVWKTEGIGLVAVQHKFESTGAENGGSPPVTFTRKWLGDLQTDYLADPFFSGWKRGREWQATSYYPFTLVQVPLVRAFFTFTDYILDDLQGTPKKGGQVGIIECTRTNTNSDWTFGSIFKIFEESADGVHFHTACWTPRGVVLAKGDGAGLNENILFTCSDWDDYTESSNWTTVRRAYGSGDHGGTDPERGYANQWAGAIPHPTDLNKMIVGGDNVEGAVYEMEVLADNTISYDRRFGMLSGNDSQGAVCLGFSGPGPETHNHFLTRDVRQVNAATLQSRLILSLDGANFASVAKTPSVGHPSNSFTIHGNDIYTFNLGGTSSVYKMPKANVTAHRGLAVAPGGLNLLEIDGTDYYSDVPFPGTTISTVSDSSAPNSNPVLDVRQPSTTADIRMFRINVSALAYAFSQSSTCAYLVMWIKSMTNSGVPIRVTWNDNGAGGNTTYSSKGIYTGVASEDWKLVVLTLEQAATPWADPHKATLTWNNATGNFGDCHFRMQMVGIYEGPQLPYFMPAETTGAMEKVTQSITGLSDNNWTVGIELHIPMGGEDHEYPTHPTNILSTIALATVYVDANNYVLITADLVNDEIDFDTVVDGSSIGVKSLSNVLIQRDDTMFLGVTFDGTNLVFFAACGGFDENGLSTDTIVGELTGTPATVRIGNDDFTEVPNTEVNQISIDTISALSSSEFLIMMNSIEDTSEVIVGSSGYTAMSHFNLVVPKII